MAAKASSCFCCTDFMLYLSGCHVFNETTRQKVISHLMLLLTVVKLGICFRIEFTAIADHFTVLSLADIAFNLSSLLVIVNLVLKRKSYKRFVKRVARLLSPAEQENVRVFGRNYSLICIAYYAAFCACLLPFLYRGVNWVYARIFVPMDNKSNVLWGIAVFAYLQELTLTTLWMPIAANVYLTTHLMKHKLSLSCLRRVMTVSSDADRFALLTLMTDVQSQFTDTFSNIPLFILTANFFEASGYILFQLINTQISLTLRAQMIGLALTFLSNAFAVCVIASHRHEELEKVRDQVIRWIEGQSLKTLDDGLLIQCVTRCVQPDSVWKIFPLENSLVPAYMGHMVTFSVLFIQMVPKSV